MNSNRDDSMRFEKDDWDRINFRSLQEVATPGIRIFPDGPYGNARLATRKQLLKLADNAAKTPEEYVSLFEAQAIAHNPELDVVRLDTLPIPLGRTSPNLLVVGRAGSGKTQNIIFPAACHTMRQDWSMVYINIKGTSQTQLLRRMAKAYGRDKDILLVAPQKPNRTLGWTGLAGCEDLSEAKEVAACMVASAAATSRYGEGAWAYNQAEEWLQHAIHVICTTKPKRDRNLLQLRRVVLSGEYQAFAAAHPESLVAEKFGRYESNGNRNAETVAATISEATAFIDDVAPFLSKEELKLEQFVQDGGCLVVEVDEYAVERMRPVIALFLSRLIAKMQRTACEAPSGQLPHKTVILIDELAASGPIYGISGSLHTCRERRYSFIAGVQSITQLPAIYGKDAEVVLAGFQSQIALPGGLDISSAEYFSRCSGTTTIAVPTAVEVDDSQVGGAVTASGWHLASRAVLLPGDIQSPKEHANLGMPATILLGDGKTPTFQAYLTPAHSVGQIEMMMDDVRAQDIDNDLRTRPLKGSVTELHRQTRRAQSGSSISNTTGWSNEQIRNRLEEVKLLIQYPAASSIVRTWWDTFEGGNSKNLRLILRLAEELSVRQATLQEFYEISEKSATLNIQANLSFYDYYKLFRSDKKNQTNPRLPSVNEVMVSPTAKSGYSITLITYTGTKLDVVKVVRSLTGVTIMEAKSLVERVPIVIGRCASTVTAQAAVDQLVEAGAVAEISQ